MQKDNAENNFLIQLGSNIAELRKAKGLTQREVSANSSIEEVNIVRIEKGRTNPTALTLRKLAIALGVKTEDFYKGLE